MMEKYLECASVATTHGVRGTLRLECLCDSPAVLRALPRMYLRDASGNMRPLTVEHASVQKNMVLASFREIDSLDAAIPYKGKTLYADRADLPLAPGAHFIADLIGLPVIDEAAGKVGVLSEVITPAGQDIYVIKKPDGGTFMLPAVPAFVLRISLGETEEEGAAGIYVRLIDGFLNDDEN